MSNRKFKAPEGATSITINGDVYNVNKKGVVQAPEELFAEMESHGFVPLDGPSDADDAGAPPPPPADADAAALAAAAALEGKP